MSCSSLCCVMACVSALSGVALFAGSARVQQTALELLFLLSLACALVIAVRLALSGLAHTFGSAECDCDDLLSRTTGNGSDAMNADSQHDHRSFTPPSHDE